MGQGHSKLSKLFAKASRFYSFIQKIFIEPIIHARLLGCNLMQKHMVPAPQSLQL